jgi:predicted RNA methylase
MAETLRLQGCARVYTSDIVDRGAGQDEVLDFLSAQMPERLARFDMSVTNPPFGADHTIGRSP